MNASTPIQYTLDQGMSRVLIAVYLLSGATSLAYEMLWTRMLALQFGVSIFGVVITVAAFMAGLGLGSLLGLRISTQQIPPLRLFALLELGVALLALATPRLLQYLDNGFAGIAGGMSLSFWYALQMLAVFFILLLPALAMGVGFPLLLRLVRRGPMSLAQLYGMNAIGGALGALAPLLLLPALGWLLAMQAVALLGFFVATSAWILSRFVKVGVADCSIMEKKNHYYPSFLHLLAYAGVGAAALMLEVGWSRLFGMVFLRTEYVLAIILAVYLIGIGAGSLLARYLRSAWFFTVLPVLAAAMIILGLWVLPNLSALIETQTFASLAEALLSQGIAIAMLTLPVTLVLGAWLPLLAARYKQPSTGAVLYGVNSLGAAAGALIAGFVLLPAIGSNATIIVSALLLVLFAVLWGRWRWILPALPVLAIVALPVSVMPQASILLPNAYGDSEDIYLHEDAIAITQVVERHDGQRLLLADLRRMDASSDPSAVEAQKDQSRLPLLLHAQPGSVLYLGMGTGISAAGSLGYPDMEKRAVELSRGAIMAAEQYFAPVNHDIVGSLDIIRDDARHFLMSDDRTYDVIIGDLFHPDLVGRSALLSVQQFRRARERLSEQGIFVQWLAINQFDPESLGVVLRSFEAVFPDGMLFLDAFRVALVGSRSPWVGASAVLHNLERLAPETQAQVTGGEGPWTWLGRYWGRLDEGAGPVQDEWAPRIEFDLPRARYDGQLDLSRVLATLLERRPQVDQAAAELQIPETNLEAFKRAYVATELAHRSWLALLRGQDREGQRLLRLAYEANPQDRWIGFAVADAMLAALPEAKNAGFSERQVLSSVLVIRSDHFEALDRLWRLEQGEGKLDEAELYRQRLQALSPLSRTLRDTVQ